MHDARQDAAQSTAHGVARGRTRATRRAGPAAYGRPRAPHSGPRRPHRPRRPYTAPTATSAAGFPSRPTARLADLADRATRPVQRLTAHLTVKRTLDLFLGTALLALAAPALAVGLAALAARRLPGGAWDRGPRAGLHGHVFELRSLRTRRLRLDLLSRLPHVLRGELSLVGPAPLAPGDPRAAGPGSRQWRQELRPGLTGLAQVRARSGMPWDDPALLDRHYAEDHGVVLDLVILAEAVRNPLRAALGRATRRTKAHLSDTDHRLPGYSVTE
ncbi:sugar transferase [Streptomyces sp. NPDC088729]|uniref:sugar transferase n=1 Tax=Streptomyces sp. NPDC088729 TaxID=3365876 RepID=UPI0038295D62